MWEMVPVVLLAALLLATPEKCTLSGTVVNSITGEPLGKAQVTAAPMDAGDAIAAFSTTDAKGNFMLVDLDPGKYRLRANRGGYLQSEKGPPLSLDAGQELKDLKIKLVPYGVIAGTVRDRDGDPLPGISVFAWRHKGRNDPDGVKTDDLGQYRIAELEPGRYYVGFAPPDLNEGRPAVDHSPKTDHPVEHLVSTYYPGVSNPAAAGTIEVVAGARIAGIDLTMLKSPVFRLKVHVEAPPGMKPSVDLLYPGTDRGELRTHSVLKPNHDLEINGIPPGSYLLRARAYNPSGPFTGVVDFNGPHAWETRIPVQISGDIDDLRVVVTPGGEVQAHVSVEGETQHSLVGSMVWFEADESTGHEGVYMKEGNVFSIQLNPRRFIPDLSSVIHGTDLYVKSIRSEKADVMRDGLTIVGPGKVPLEVVLAADGGKIDGIVLDKDDKPAAGATVVVAPVPEFRERADGWRTALADQDGRFQLNAIPPGNAKLFVWAEVEDGAWLDPAFMKDKEANGEVVKIEPASTQTVTLHLK